MELAMLIAGCILMSRVAAMEKRSPFLWGIMTFVLCLGITFIVPFRYIRVIVTLVVLFAVMLGLNLNDAAGQKSKIIK